MRHYDQSLSVFNAVDAMYADVGFNITVVPPDERTGPGTRHTGLIQSGLSWLPEDLCITLAINEALPIKTVYSVGNAIGYSTMCILTAIPGSVVDGIDPDSPTYGTGKATALSKLVLQKNYPGRWSLTCGFSPDDVPRSVPKGRLYDFVFIDGEHSATQALKDAEAVIPFLAEKCAILFHDVGWGWGQMGSAFDTIDRERPQSIFGDDASYTFPPGVSYMERLLNANNFTGFCRVMRAAKDGPALAVRGIDTAPMMSLAGDIDDLRR